MVTFSGNAFKFIAQLSPSVSFSLYVLAVLAPRLIMELLFRKCPCQVKEFSGSAPELILQLIALYKRVL